MHERTCFIQTKQKKIFMINTRVYIKWSETPFSTQYANGHYAVRKTPVFSYPDLKIKVQT